MTFLMILLLHFNLNKIKLTGVSLINQIFQLVLAQIVAQFKNYSISVVAKVWLIVVNNVKLKIKLSMKVDALIMLNLTSNKNN